MNRRKRDEDEGLEEEALPDVEAPGDDPDEGDSIDDDSYEPPRSP